MSQQRLGSTVPTADVVEQPDALRGDQVRHVRGRSADAGRWGIDKVAKIRSIARTASQWWRNSSAHLYAKVVSARDPRVPLKAVAEVPRRSTTFAVASAAAPDQEAGWTTSSETEETPSPHSG